MEMSILRTFSVCGVLLRVWSESAMVFIDWEELCLGHLETSASHYDR